MEWAFWQTFNLFLHTYKLTLNVDTVCLVTLHANLHTIFRLDSAGSCEEVVAAVEEKMDEEACALAIAAKDPVHGADFHERAEERGGGAGQIGRE